MTNSRVTLRDVAAAAHVSVTTASEALRGLPRVEAATRDHVRTVARQLGYRTDLRARSMKGQQGRVVATVLPLPSTKFNVLPKSYWLRCHFVVTDRLAQHGIANFLLPEHMAEMVDWWPVDAILWLRDSAGNSGELPTNLPFGIPVVGLGVPEAVRDQFAAVVPENAAEAMMATVNHLRERGARKVALLLQDSPFAPTGVMREFALTHNGVELDLHAITCTDAPASYVADLLSQGFDSFVLQLADSPLQQMAVIDAIEGAGGRIPDDVMVLTWGETGHEDAIAPGLTTLTFDSEEYGRRLADMIDEGLRTGDFHDLDVPFALTARASTARKSES